MPTKPHFNWHSDPDVRVMLAIRCCAGSTMQALARFHILEAQLRGKSRLQWIDQGEEQAR